MKIKKIISDLRSFIIECKRVFKLARKPTKEEYLTIVKASGLGIIIIGGIGFILTLIRMLIPRFI